MCISRVDMIKEIRKIEDVIDKSHFQVIEFSEFLENVGWVDEQPKSPRIYFCETKEDVISLITRLEISHIKYIILNVTGKVTVSIKFELE